MNADFPDFPEFLLDNLADGVYYVDKERKITYWNETAEKITGFSKAEIIGRSCANNILRHIDDSGCELCENGCPLQQTIEDGEKREALVYLHHKQGHRVPVHVRVAPLKDKKGSIIGAIETFTDQSTSLDMLKDMEHLKEEAFQDPLLGIGNRRYAETVFETHANRGVPLGIIFVDIDSFKKVNDRHGHVVGDKVLIMAIQTVKNVLRKSDLLVRWGGDEFVVFLPGVTLEDLQLIAERVTLFIERSFIITDKHKVSVTVSTGATFVKEGETLESAIKRSDALMYVSKHEGRNKVTLG